MTFKELSLEASKAVLKSYNVENWTSSPEVLRSWHIFFYSLIFYLLIDLFAGWLALGLLSQVNLVVYLRIYRIIGSAWLFLIFVTLAVQYYRFLLLKGKDLRFGVIIFFFIGGIFFLGKLYATVYCLLPTVFTYKEPWYVPDDIIRLSWRTYLMVLDFLLYSFLSAFTLTYYKIQSASTFVSLLNACGILYALFMVSAFVATFVQKVGGDHRYHTDEEERPNKADSSDG